MDRFRRGRAAAVGRRAVRDSGERAREIDTVYELIAETIEERTTAEWLELLHISRYRPRR